VLEARQSVSAQLASASAFGKLLERIVYAQFAPFISDNELLCNKQHGFISGRSTLTNLLICDATIAQIVSQRHPYDILSFDFAKAFDKAPHKLVISSLAQHGIDGKVQDWLVSFLTGCTFCVRVGECYSRAANVSSGVIQGSTLGPVLYDLFIDSLFAKAQTGLLLAFADDVKIVADVATYPVSVVQSDINTLADWAHTSTAHLCRWRNVQSCIGAYISRATIITSTQSLLPALTAFATLACCALAMHAITRIAARSSLRPLECVALFVESSTPVIATRRGPPLRAMCSLYCHTAPQFGARISRATSLQSSLYSTGSRNNDTWL
jgi:hypothetical protein